MRRTAETMIIALLATAMLGGCAKLGLGFDKGQADAEGEEYLPNTAIRNEDKAETGSAVDAALEWAQRYAEVAAKLDQLQQANRALAETGRQQEKQITELQAKLTRAERELGEGNEMLLEMREELAKWKANVLGFRDEMRQAMKVQMDAQVKILTLVGGQVAEPALTAQAAPADGEGGEQK